MSFTLFCSPPAPPAFAATPMLAPNRARVARLRCSRLRCARLRLPWPVAASGCTCRPGSMCSAAASS
eukprot:132299-Prymnesium_polylepis.1